MSPRPGIAKVRRVPHVARTTKSFVRTLDGAVKSWIELADVVSEGQVRAEVHGGESYFGSSSILLEWDRAPDQKLREVSYADVLASDPHLRLRALRIARREAEARAGGELSCMRCDLSTAFSPRGLVLFVDVEARVRATSPKKSSVKTSPPPRRR